MANTYSNVDWQQGAYQHQSQGLELEREFDFSMPVVSDPQPTNTIYASSYNPNLSPNPSQPSNGSTNHYPGHQHQQTSQSQLPQSTFAPALSYDQTPGGGGPSHQSHRRAPSFGAQAPPPNSGFALAQQNFTATTSIPRGTHPNGTYTAGPSYAANAAHTNSIVHELNNSENPKRARSYYNNPAAYERDGGPLAGGLTASTALEVQQQFYAANTSPSIPLHDSFSPPSHQHATLSPPPQQQQFQPQFQPHPHQQQTGASYYPPTGTGTVPDLNGGHSANKRARPNQPEDEPDSLDDGPAMPDAKESKSKPPGACARCKNLKVRCEFRTDTDPCKRCLNGGHECVVPGRKKRRTPPKREHLLNQIREQAEKIEELMGHLERMGGRDGVRPASSRGPGATVSPTSVAGSTPGHADLHSPVLSPTSTTSASAFGAEGSSYFTSSANGSGGGDPATQRAVEAWLAKARESLAEFGGLLIAGAGLPKSFVAADDPDDDDDDDAGDSEGDGEFLENEGEGEDYVDVGEGEVHVAVERAEDDGMSTTDKGPRLRAQASTGSLYAAAMSPNGSTLAMSPNASMSPNMNGGARRLAKLVTHPPEASPFGMFARLTIHNHRARATEGEGGDNNQGDEGVRGADGADGEDGEGTRVGLANPAYFGSDVTAIAARAKALNAQQHLPHILTRGVVTLEEAQKLFDIYFERMNLSVSLLDPVLYTPDKTCARSPFLFTVICAIASRFYSARPELYSQAMHYAQLAAGTSLISGPKSVEAVHAYILLSLYPVPARRWEEDRGWLYLGLAIRFAIDLNLHHPTTARPQNELHAREMLNRTRAWLNCFNLDRSTGSQYGKAPIIPNSDYVANHSENWWRSSAYNMTNFDIHLCAYNAELRVMSAFTAKIYSDPNHPTGLNKEVDFERLATETDEELKRLGDKWFAVLQQTDLTDEHNCFRTGLLKLAYSYARLVALSYAFQHAFGKSPTDENPFLMRCLAAATDVVNVVTDDIGRPNQRIYLRHGPEAQSVFATFAAAFLVKLLQPKFTMYLTHETRVEIRRLVMKIVELLGGSEVAIDDRHGPKLYARFLKNLLASPMAKVDQSRNVNGQARHSPSRSTFVRSSSKSSSESPEPSRPAAELPPTANSSSPAATTCSLSPPPTQLAMSFDRFAPQGAAIDPFIGGGFGHVGNAQTGMSAQDALGMTMNMSEYFQPPLPFDQAIASGLQDLNDPSLWQSISDGSWLTHFSEATNQHLKSHNDSMMFDGTMRQ